MFFLFEIFHIYMKYSIFTDGLLCMFYASYFNLNILQSNNIYIFQVWVKIHKWTGEGGGPMTMYFIIYLCSRRRGGGPWLCTLLFTYVPEGGGDPCLCSLLFTLVLEGREGDPCLCTLLFTYVLEGREGDPCLCTLLGGGGGPMSM